MEPLARVMVAMVSGQCRMWWWSGGSAVSWKRGHGAFGPRLDPTGPNWTHPKPSESAPSPSPLSADSDE